MKARAYNRWRKRGDVQPLECNVICEAFNGPLGPRVVRLHLGSDAAGIFKVELDEIAARELGRQLLKLIDSNAHTFAALATFTQAAALKLEELTGVRP